MLPAYHRAFAPEWQQSAEEAGKQAISHHEHVKQYYNQHAQALPKIHIGSSVAVQNPTTKQWDIYSGTSQTWAYTDGTTLRQQMGGC